MNPNLCPCLSSTRHDAFELRSYKTKVLVLRMYCSSTAKRRYGLWDEERVARKKFTLGACRVDPNLVIDAETVASQHFSGAQREKEGAVTLVSSVFEFD